MSKKFRKKQRIKLWEKYFGNLEEGEDAFGRIVKRNDFDCDHIYPKSLGGGTNLNNGMPLHRDSNREKADKTKGFVNGKEFFIDGSSSRPILMVEGEIKSK